MTQAIDCLDFSDVDEANAVEEYRALVRSLRRKQGFGFFFVQASPAKGQEILTDLRRDLPQKKVVEVMIGRTDERLFEQLEAVRDREKVDIFWIEGLDQSLLGYEDMQRSAGWDELDLMTYSWKDVPPILSHLNLGRERFEAQFDCALVFVVPLFVVKYLLRRAGDFFDWKSGFFEFPDDRQALADRVIEDSDYEKYLKLNAAERLEKILRIKDLLDAPEIEVDRRTQLLYEVGQIFRVGKEYEQAITSYEHALELQSDLVGSLNCKGLALRALGRYEQAIEAHQSAIRSKPHYGPTYKWLGQCYFIQKNYTEAVEAYQKAIELYYGTYFPIIFNPSLEKYLSLLTQVFTFIIYWMVLPISNALAYIETANLLPILNPAIKSLRFGEQAFNYRALGNAYASQERYKQAVIAYKCAIALNPKYATAYNDLGITYKVQKRYEEAITAYQRAIALNPEYARAFANRGSTYGLMKRYEEALKDFDRAIELEPTAWIFSSRGQTCQALKLYDEALKDFDRAIEIDSEYVWAITCRGQTYRTLKCYEEALKDFDRAIEIDSEYVWAITCRGQTYQTLKCHEEALKDFDRAIELDPTDWKFGQRGETYRLMKCYEEALKDFDQAIALNPEYARAFANRGETYRFMKRYEEALKDFDRLIELDSEYSWAITCRSEVYLFLNQPEKVTATEIPESYEGGWRFYIRALAYLKLSQPEPAETDFQKAIAIAQAAYEKDPIDYQNTFNLALYHLAAAHPEESDRLYTSNLTAPLEWLQMAIDDLDDFLHLFPDHTQAQQVKQRLQGAIEATQPIAL